MDRDVVRYRAWLIAERDLAERTADVYSAMIDLGKRHGSIVDVIRRAKTKGTLTVAFAAVTLWCKYRHDNRLLGLARKALERNHNAEDRTVPTATNDERSKLRERVVQLEEPYRSAMVVVTDAGLKLGTIFGLSRTQMGLGFEDNLMPVVKQDDVIMWTPPVSVRTAFGTLLTYGGWERLQDLFGRDYNTAYLQLRVLLHHECRMAGLRMIRPGELSRGESSRNNLDTASAVA